MELLGKSLEDLFQSMGKKFTIKTVCMVGIQMLDRLEFIHFKNMIQSLDRAIKILDIYTLVDNTLRSINENRATF